MSHASLGGLAAVIQIKPIVLFVDSPIYASSALRYKLTIDIKGFI